MKTKLTVLVLFVAMSVGPSAVARPLSRREVIALALSVSPRVAAARAEEMAATAVKGQADAARWPQLSLATVVGPTLQASLVPGTAVLSTKSAYNSSLGINDFTAFVDAELSLIQPLYTFGKISSRREAAEAGIRARKAQTEMTRQEVALQAAQFYEGFLYARDAELFFEEIDHTLAGSLQSTSDRLTAGKQGVSSEDMLRLQVAQRVAALGRNRARAAQREAAAAVRAWIGLPSGDDLEVSEAHLDAISEGAPEDAQALAALALAHRPELAALDAGATARHRLADAERSGYWPDLFAMGYVSAAYAPGRDLVDTRYTSDPYYHFVPGIVVGLNWKLQGPMAGRRADEADAEALALEQTRRWVVAAVPAAVQKPFEEARRARGDIGDCTEGLHAAKQWLVHTTADYAAGLTDSRAVTDSVEAYAMLRTSSLEARYRFNTALAELAWATGTLGENGSTIYPGVTP